MPIRTEHWICLHCSQPYADRERALLCENSHKTRLSLSSPPPSKKSIISNKQFSLGFYLALLLLSITLIGVCQ